MATHLALPLTVLANGQLGTVEQDSPADLAQSVALLVDTTVGERRSIPDYGIPDPVFGHIDPRAITDAILEWEDRADLALAEQTASGITAQGEIYPDSTGATVADYYDFVDVDEL